MQSQIKNIIIFLVIAALLSIGYFKFFGGGQDTGNLVSAPLGGNTSGVVVPAGGQSEIAQNFLSTLLNLKGIKLDASIINDSAFKNLKDSSITLTADGNEGRPNPFAQFGADSIENTGQTNAGSTSSTGL